MNEQFVADHPTDNNGQPDNHETRIQGLEEAIEQQQHDIADLEKSFAHLDRS